MRMRPLVLMLALSLAALAQAYTLQFKDAAGTTRTYKSQMTITGTMSGAGMTLPIEAAVEMALVEKVLDVRNQVSSVSYGSSNGVMRVKVTGLPGEEEEETIDQDLPDFTFTYNRTPQGKVSNVKTHGEITNLFLGPADMLLNPLENPGQGLELPAGDVKIGDTWTGTQTALVGTAQAKVTAKYTLAGTEVVDGKTYLKITSDTTISVPGATVNAGDQEKENPVALVLNLKGRTTTLFDQAAGAPFRTTFTLAGTMTMNGPETMGMEVKTTLNVSGTMEKAAN
ncbi:MAG: hypothetical protein ACYDCO_08320 [Armatimonadota bacterium]